MKTIKGYLIALSFVFSMLLIVPASDAVSGLLIQKPFTRAASGIAGGDPTTLTICLADEPNTLYLYGDSSHSKSSILEAIYDGPIDYKSFDYHAVILEKIPSLADNDAVLQVAPVQEGDTIVDADNNVTNLMPGVSVIPYGQTNPITYTGGNINLDQLVVTFTLKSALTWSDGTALTSKDSVYSFQLAGDPSTPASKDSIDRTESYQSLDSLTIRWTGLPGYRDSTYQTKFWTPLPEHIWSSYSAYELITAPVSSQKPIGWGPYVIDERVEGYQISLHKNPNYFRSSEGLPAFDKLVFRFVGTNSNANLAALLSAECDILDETTRLDDQTKLVLELDSAGQIDATLVTGTYWEHIDFGIQHIDYDDGYDGGIYDRPDFFSDVRVRHAFAYCMDRQRMVDEVMFGQSIVLDTYMSPEHPLFSDNVTSYDYNPTTGEALLTQVGWIDYDRDGVREAHGVKGVPDGTKFEVNYGSTSTIPRQQIAQIVNESLSSCGIKVNINFYPSSEWFKDGPGGVLFGRKFDLGEFSWWTDTEACQFYVSKRVPGDSLSTWIPIMSPSAGPQSFLYGWDRAQGAWNETGYYNSAYNAACNTASSSLPGQHTFTTGHKESQRIFAEDLPVLPLYLRLRVAATRPGLVGFILDPTVSGMWNIEGFTLSSQPQPVSNIYLPIVVHK